jgi:hypothetical protein
LAATNKENIIQSIIASANKYGVPPELALAIAQQESGFNPNAKSPVGAQGVFQLMPATAKELGVSNSYDPEQNIDGGVRYVAQLLGKYKGDVPQSLAAYNWGMGNLSKEGMKNAPAETQNYVSNILGKLGKKGIDYATNPIKTEAINQANQIIGANTPEGVFGSGYFTESNIPTSPQAAVKQVGNYLGANTKEGFLNSGYLTESSVPTSPTDLARLAGKETGLTGPQGVWNSNIPRMPSAPSGYESFGFEALGKFPIGASGSWMSSAEPAVQNLASLGNGGLETWGGAANAGGLAGMSTLGAATTLAGGAAGAYGLYNLGKNFNNMSPEKGALQGAGSGAALGASIGAMFGGIGAVPGALIGGALGGIGGLFAHKPQTQVEEGRWRDLAKKGLVSEDMVPDWVREGKDIKAKGAGMRNDLDPNFVGFAPTAGERVGLGQGKQGDWVNNKFGASRNEADLRPEDIWGYAKMYETFGPEYAKGSEENRRAIAQKALELGAIDENKGTIDVKSTPDLMNYWNSIKGSSPVASGKPAIPQIPQMPSPTGQQLAPPPAVWPSKPVPVPLKPTPADWAAAMKEIDSQTPGGKPIRYNK